MKKSNKDYNDILTMVTHDLKSPMTAVIGELDFLSLDDLTQFEKEQSIKQAKKASRTVLKLIENILVMAKLEAGKLPIKLKNIEDLPLRFKDIIKTFKYQMKVRNIKFDISIPSKLIKVNWDFESLHYHAINNIISNAIKFTPDGGNIQLTVKNKKDKYIIITIKDNGIGINKKEKENIFNKYDTYHNQKVFKGTGLGLYNAYYFVKEHKGDIKVSSGIKGEGTGFKIILPINPLEEK